MAKLYKFSIKPVAILGIILAISYEKTAITNSQDYLLDIPKVPNAVYMLKHKLCSSHYTALSERDLSEASRFKTQLIIKDNGSYFFLRNDSKCYYKQYINITMISHSELAIDFKNTESAKDCHFQAENLIAEAGSHQIVQYKQNDVFLHLEFLDNPSTEDCNGHSNVQWVLKKVKELKAPKVLLTSKKNKSKSI